MFQAMLDLISGVLEIGISDNEYTQTLTDVRDCLPQGLGLNDINLLLTLLEIVLNFSTNANEIRGSYGALLIHLSIHSDINSQTLNNL